MENKDMNMEIEEVKAGAFEELDDECLEEAAGGLNLVFNKKLCCPLCGPRITLLGGLNRDKDERECPLCGRKFNLINGKESGVTDLRYYVSSDEKKGTLL